MSSLFKTIIIQSTLNSQLFVWALKITGYKYHLFNIIITDINPAFTIKVTVYYYNRMDLANMRFLFLKISWMASPQDYRVIENEVTFVAYNMTSSWIFNFTLNFN
jgi:hypothetical protein